MAAVPLINVMIALAVPWVAGFLLAQQILRRRKGSSIFACGAGFFIAVLLISSVMRLSDAIGLPFSFRSLVSIQFAIVAALIILRYHFPLPAQSPSCRSDLTPLQWYIVCAIFLFLAVRLSIVTMDLLYKPLIPWDGWFSWSAKAKIFFYEKSIVQLYDERTPWWEFRNAPANAIGGMRHMNMLPLLQAYIAISYGEWQDSYINVPWVLCGLACSLVIWGGLRYARFSVMECTVAAYLFLSLPIVNIHMSLGSYADLWVGSGLLIFALGSIIAARENERLMLIMAGLGLLIVLSSKPTAMWVFPAYLLLWIYNRLGWRWALFAVGLAALTMLALNGEYLAGFFDTIDEMLNLHYPPVEIIYNEKVLKDSVTFFLLYDNWHFVFWGALVSSIFLLAFWRNGHREDVAIDLFLLSWILLLVLFCMVSFTSRIPVEEFSRFANRLMLQIPPIFCLIPILVHHLLNSSLPFPTSRRSAKLDG